MSARKSIEARKDFEYGNLKLENEFYTLGLIFSAERLWTLSGLPLSRSIPGIGF